MGGIPAIVAMLGNDKFSDLSTENVCDSIDVICIVLSTILHHNPIDQYLSSDAMSATCRSRRSKIPHPQEIRTTSSTSNQIIFIGHATKEHPSL